MINVRNFLIIYILAINVIAFSAMGIDKSRAKRHKWRISEKVLFILVLLGGGLGGSAAMYTFRHKTKHWYFVIGFPLITLFEYIITAAVYLYVKK